MSGPKKRELADVILDTLGIDPANVTDFSLHFPMDGAATIVITKILDVEPTAAGDLPRSMKTYRIEEVE